MVADFGSSSMAAACYLTNKVRTTVGSFGHPIMAAYVHVDALRTEGATRLCCSCAGHLTRTGVAAFFLKGLPSSPSNGTVPFEAGAAHLHPFSYLAHIMSVEARYSSRCHILSLPGDLPLTAMARRR